MSTTQHHRVKLCHDRVEGKQGKIAFDPTVHRKKSRLLRKTLYYELTHAHELHTCAVLKRSILHKCVPLRKPAQIVITFARNDLVLSMPQAVVFRKSFVCSRTYGLYSASCFFSTVIKTREKQTRWPQSGTKTIQVLFLSWSRIVSVDNEPVKQFEWMTHKMNAHHE